MKLVVSLSCSLLAVNERESKDKEGKPKIYYSVSVLTDDGQAGMIPCSDEAAVSLQEGNFDPMTRITAHCEYNDAYGSFKVVAYEPALPFDE